MSKKDYYEILEIAKNADHGTIRSAYRRLAVKFHPDKHQGDKKAEEKFKEISEAYEILSDENKKPIYDQYGHEGLKGAFGSSGFKWENFTHFQDISDIFGGLDDVFNIFGGSSDIFGFRSSSRRGPRKGTSIQAYMDITLEEAVKGVEKTIEIKKHDACSVCQGRGVEPGAKEEKCDLCKGKGRVVASSGFFSVTTACSRCHGEGVIIKNPCKKCNGSGATQVKKKIKVNIPKGIDTNTRLRVSNEGNTGEKGGPAGDLFVLINVVEHPIFKRHDDDIYCDVKVSFAQVVFGTEIEVLTFDDEKQMLKIPKGTQSGKVFCIKHKGVPHLQSSGRGNLYCRAMVQTPTNLDGEQANKLKDFAASCGENIKAKSKRFVDKMKKAFK